MYKFLLCWRYLRTRYIALFSIVSVMLGVATMIVVNAVMEGFTYEMQERIHGILSDVVFESATLDGIPDADRHMRDIQRIAGDDIAGMSPTVHVPAMLSFKVGRQYVNKQISLIGVDEKTYSTVSDFGRYLQHPDNRKQLDFRLKDGGYDTQNYEAAVAGKGIPRPQMSMAGWLWRRQMASFQVRAIAPPGSTEGNPFSAPGNPLAVAAPQGEDFDPAKKQHDGCVLGISLVSYRNQDGSDSFLSLPGDDVDITYPSAGTPPKPLSAKFTVVDFYESKMNEYDSSFVFVPIRKLQELRGTIDPETGVGNFNSIQIRLKPGADMDAVRDKLRAAFPSQLYIISTWRDKQGALLAAVQMETAVLNLLLFLIIAVAGFGILAIFLMIVVEKTRDIGILKSLGATGSGILSIFLSYGLSLGIVGAGVGVALGLAFVVYINEIADLIGRATGRPVFDPSIYYFHEIPTIIEPLTVALVAAGAIVIAVLASILPAWRAASLHPVEALRYE
ncbi:MAG: FtsX-like permease family protein [Pirellulales bacterium]